MAGRLIYSTLQWTINHVPCVTHCWVQRSVIAEWLLPSCYAPLAHLLIAPYGVDCKFALINKKKLLFQTTLILRRIQRDIVVNVHTRSPSEVLDVLVKCYWNFTDRFSKNTEILNFVKILLVWAELFHADEQTQRLTDVWTDGNNSRFS
jgi:hypothetical protein